MKINFGNVEALVFFDEVLRKKLPEFRPLFDQWRISQMSPELRSLGKRSIIDFLNSIKECHKEIIENHLGKNITIDNKLDYRSVYNVSGDFSTIERYLNEKDIGGSLTTYFDGESLCLTLWK